MEHCPHSVTVAFVVTVSFIVITVIVGVMVRVVMVVVVVIVVTAMIIPIIIVIHVVMVVMEVKQIKSLILGIVIMVFIIPLLHIALYIIICPSPFSILSHVPFIYFCHVWIFFCHLCPAALIDLTSVLRSGPRTDERLPTGPDRSHLGLDHSLGPVLIVQGAVLVLTFLHRIKDWLRTSLDWSFHYNVGITFH